MEEIILSYKESCRLVKKRINELSIMLNDANTSDIEENIKLRKNTLSSQLYHMNEIIKILEDYQKRIDLLEKETH